VLTLATTKASRVQPIPARAGVGLRAEHYRDVLDTRPAIGWFEVHSENYFGEGGRPLAFLEAIRTHYPLSLHGVGLSLGSTDELSHTHLARIKQLIDRFQPGLVSEHLSWSSIGGRYLNDLLPLPYTEEALAHVVARIARVQDYLGRRILVENISRYLEYKHTTIAEWDFLAAVARQSDCGILLDVNNIYVNAVNHGFDALTYLRAIPRDLVQEIHLAGFTVNRFEGGEIIIDSHNRPVAGAVWTLYQEAIGRFGPRPTLIEWDTELPALTVLISEAHQADAIMEQNRADAA
jgi:uncharacterized protein (UPF0276 family)